MNFGYSARGEDELVDPADELGLTELGRRVHRSLRAPAVAGRLHWLDPAVPDQRLDGVVQRPGVDPEAAVLVPLRRTDASRTGCIGCSCNKPRMARASVLEILRFAIYITDS